MSARIDGRDTCPQCGAATEAQAPDERSCTECSWWIKRGVTSEGPDSVLVGHVLGPTTEYLVGRIEALEDRVEELERECGER